MRAAVVGGAAYHVGKTRAQSQQREADQNAQIEDLQQQQSAQQPQYAAPQAAPPTGGGGDSITDQLTKLKGLLDSGVLTQDEFNAAKQRVIQGG